MYVYIYIYIHIYIYKIVHSPPSEDIQMANNLVL